MKKRSKIIVISLAALIVLAIVLIVVISFKNAKHFKVLAIAKHHSLIYEELPTIDVSLYASEKDHYYLKTQNINQVLLYDNSDSYQFVVEDLQKGSREITKDNDQYYEFILSGHLDVESLEQITLHDANVKILYQNDDFLDVKIGNVAFQKLKTDTDIQVKKVQSIVVQMDDYTTLSAILLSIASRSQPLMINNILPISSSFSIS